MNRGGHLYRHRQLPDVSCVIKIFELGRRLSRKKPPRYDHFIDEAFIYISGESRWSDSNRQLPDFPDAPFSRQEHALTAHHFLATVVYFCSLHDAAPFLFDTISSSRQ